MKADHPDPDHRATVLDAYRAKGLAGRVGFGSAPAIVVVDFIVGFTDEASPLASDLASELDATIELLETARARSIPIFFTTTAYDEALSQAGIFPLKVPALKVLVRGTRWVEVDPRLGRAPSEPVIEKHFASAFFGTALAAELRAIGVDTVIVAGCTTSGCIRATVVDSLQNGFRSIVPQECVGDRSPEQHAANLVDIDGKYGDVVRLADAVAFLSGFPETP